MKIAFYFIFFCVFLSTKAQTNNILTCEQNEKWLNSLSLEKSLSSKIRIISNRILNDTVIYHQGSIASANTTEIKARYKTTTKARPVYILVNQKNEIITSLDANIENEKALNLIKILNTQNIKNIEIVSVEKASLYGSRYKGGVINVVLRNESITDLVINAL